MAQQNYGELQTRATQARPLFGFQICWRECMCPWEPRKSAQGPRAMDSVLCLA